MTRPGIEPSTFLTQGGHSTTEPRVRIYSETTVLINGHTILQDNAKGRLNVIKGNFQDNKLSFTKFIYWYLVHLKFSKLFGYTFS